MSRPHYFKDLLRTLIGQSSEEENSEPMTEEMEEEEEAEKPAPRPVSAAPRRSDRSDLENCRPMKGSLLQLWDIWAGGRMAPLLSLTGRLPDDALLLDRQQLEREHVLLQVKLEQHAKKRLQEIAALIPAMDAAMAAEQAAEGQEGQEKKPLPGLDASVYAHVSKDKMICWIFLFPPWGSGVLPPDAVGKALEAVGVTSGIAPEQLLGLFQEKPYFDLVPVAIGTPVKEGSNGRIVELFTREIPQEVKIDDEGMADYKYSNYVRQLSAGDAICDIIPPVEGQPGTRIDGTVVPAKTVRAARIPMGKNTHVSEDGLQLLASIEGHLQYKNDRFHILPVLTVEGDVDYGVGNIDFSGDVHIKGDVRENFQVIASGSIVIDGLVEAATVEAGGDLTISRGVVGDNRALLRSSGCVRVKYLENCVVYAGKGVYADCIMNSQIFSDSSIEVITGRGSIIGGALTAAQSIRAKMIGAQSGRRTDITLGALPYVQNELQNIEEDLAATRREKQELEKTLSYLEEKHGMEGGDARFAKARMRRSVLEMKAQQLIRRREQLRPLSPEITHCFLQAEVVYPVTRLTLQEMAWVAQDVRKRCKVRFDEETQGLKEVVY